MAKKYRVGIIGRTGKGNYGHGLSTVWKNVPECEVVAVADDNEKGLAAAHKNTGAQTAYSSYKEMLAKEKLDIVTICQRWIDKHHEMAMAATEHGCHIYMEKPFVRNLEEADDIVKACEMRHLKLAIAHGNRYSPQVGFIRKLIADGEIGDVLEVRVRGKEDRRGGGEDLWVLGTHMLDLTRLLFGDVESCYAKVTQDGKPVTKTDVYSGNEGIGPLAGDGVNAMYRLKNGVSVYFASHRGKGGRPSRFGLTIFGSKGVIEVQSGYGRTAYLLRDSAWSPGRTGKKWVPITTGGVDKPAADIPGSHAGANLATVHDLIHAIEKDKQPLSNMYDARAATEMIVGVFESHRIGGPVQFPLKNRKNPLTML